MRSFDSQFQANDSDFTAVDSELGKSDSAAYFKRRLLLPNGARIISMCTHFKTICAHSIPYSRALIPGLIKPIQREIRLRRLFELGSMSGVEASSEGRMARQSDEERLARQRAYQQEKRMKDAKARRPGRDDVARTALFWIVKRMAERTPHEMELFQERIVEMLVEQGFDHRASDAVLDELIDKYRSGEPPFRRKVHLLFPDGRPPLENEEND